MRNFILAKGWLALPLCLALLSTQCKRRQAVAVAVGGPVADSASRPVQGPMAIALPPALAAKLNPDYTFCKGRLKALYQGENQSLPFTISFRTERGVQTTFAVTAALGIPVATGWIRTDSVYVDNRMGGGTVKEPLARLRDMTGLPADLGVLEAILSGRYALPAGFAPTAASDTNLAALPLPQTDWQLTMAVPKAQAWPSGLALQGREGRFSVSNQDVGPGPGPGRTTIVQQDSAGRVLTSLRLDAVSREFNTARDK